MIRSAFEARTDTLATWGLLQANCLLVKAEEEQEEKAREESTLSRRLREAREARKEAAQARRAKTSGKKTTDPLIRRLPQARKVSEEAAKARTKELDQPPDYLQPVSSSTSAPGESPGEKPPPVIGTSREESPRARKSAFKSSKPCWFTVKGSGRHIKLPAAGALVLGRFDATFGIPPDIDLAYEDGNNHSVSRRHATVVGTGGYHTIEDTGSRYGVFVNGQQIKPGMSRQLEPGDRVAVGSIQMFYDQVPEYMQDIPMNTPIRHILIVTPTGRKLKIAPPEDTIIGRSDPYVDSIPDIDLSQDGEVANRVSRRHAMIQWRNDRPYLEDLGSGFGTRINGEMVMIGQPVLLNPGDHIWLGGCVLAYDIEM
jgi:pSer/pThr/pTyr-binding forkhead associated (FHA) protein